MEREKQLAEDRQALVDWLEAQAGIETPVTQARKVKEQLAEAEQAAQRKRIEQQTNLEQKRKAYQNREQMGMHQAQPQGSARLASQDRPQTQQFPHAEMQLAMQRLAQSQAYAQPCQVEKPDLLSPLMPGPSHLVPGPSDFTHTAQGLHFPLFARHPQPQQATSRMRQIPPLTAPTYPSPSQLHPQPRLAQVYGPQPAPAPSYTARSHRSHSLIPKPAPGPTYAAARASQTAKGKVERSTFAEDLLELVRAYGEMDINKDEKVREKEKKKRGEAMNEAMWERYAKKKTDQKAVQAEQKEEGKVYGTVGVEKRVVNGVEMRTFNEWQKILEGGNETEVELDEDMVVEEGWEEVKSDGEDEREWEMVGDIIF
jgi:hypothetical protein